MKTRSLIALSAALVAAMALFAWLTAARLPAGALLPTHWNASGQPDSWSPALDAMLIPVAIALVVTALFALIPRIEPLQDRMEGSAPLLRASWLGVLGVLVVVQATIGLPAWGVTVPVNGIMLAIGLLFLVIGNVLPKSRPGFFVGIRTPWTITDTDNWIATHRLGGKLMMAAGAAIIVASLLPIGAETTAIVVLASVAVGAGVPVLYSWWYWHRAKRAA